MSLLPPLPIENNTDITKDFSDEITLGLLGSLAYTLNRLATRNLSHPEVLEAIQAIVDDQALWTVFEPLIMKTEELRPYLLATAKMGIIK